MAEAATQTKPGADIYILQGDDDLSIRDYLNDLFARLRAENVGGLDIEELDGQTTSLAVLKQALNSLSLLSPQRVVVLAQALEVFKKKEDGPWLTDTLKQLPTTTRLVLLIPDSQRYFRGEMIWQKVTARHWLHASLADSGRQMEWVQKPLPSQREMPTWIMTEVARQGGRFDGRAAAELANLVGSNLFQARQEIAKAISYVGPDGIVSREDVRLLCSQSREEDIFEMVDAVGGRNAQRALSLLQRLLQDLPAQYIYTMLARQVRLLIMARDLLDEGGNQEALAARAGLHAFVAKKAMTQARHFSMGELEDLYAQLDRMDEDAKTGTVTLEVAMEALVAEISQGR